MKHYSINAYNELINGLNKNVEGSNIAIAVLTTLIDEVEEIHPGIRDRFIHDMGAFMTMWFDMVRDSNHCTKNLRAKILTYDMISKYSHFNHFVVFCYDVVDQDINPKTNKLYVDEILSHLTCVVKSIVQTTRRNIGLDLNSKKYGDKNN